MTKSRHEKSPEVSETLSLLQASGMLDEAREQKAQRIAEERKRAARQRAEIDAIREKEFPQLNAALAKRIAQVEAAEKALAAAQLAHADTFRANLSRKMALNGEFDELSARLLATCDPALDDFIREMRDEQAKARRAAYGREIEEKHPVTGNVRRRIESNSASVTARVDAIRAAMDAAERMKLDPDQSQVPERLQAIRDALPAVQS